MLDFGRSPTSKMWQLHSNSWDYINNDDNNNNNNNNTNTNTNNNNNNSNINNLVGLA